MTTASAPGEETTTEPRGQGHEWNSERPGRPAAALGWAARATGAALGLIALLVATFAALGLSPGAALQTLWDGAFGAPGDHLHALSETLVETSPLLLTGLAIVVTWRTGLFSIGGEGQLLMGALAATAVARFAISLPPPLVDLLMLIGGIAAGAGWGWIAGWLRVRRNVQEVISTIMLNYVALYMVQWMVTGPLQERAHVGPYSDALPDSLLFARLIPSAWNAGIPTRLHSGVLLAFLAVPLISILLFRSTAGFGMRVVGQNADAARTARFPVDRLRLASMGIAGGLAGLAGAVELLGVNGRLAGSFSPGWGYTSIPVALLGGLTPGGTMLSALFFGGLTAGCGNLERNAGVSSTLVNLIQGAAVLAVVGLRAWQRRRAGGETD